MEISKRIKEIQKEVMKVDKIISKKIGQDFSVSYNDLMNGWIQELFERELSKEQISFIKETLEKHYGKLDRPHFSQVYNKVKKGRHNNFKFFTYFNVKY